MAKKKQKDKRKRQQPQQQKRKKQKILRRPPCWIQNCTELLPPADDEQSSASNVGSSLTLTLQITVAALNDGYQGLETSSSQRAAPESRDFVAHIVPRGSKEKDNPPSVMDNNNNPVYVHRLPHDPLPPAPPPLSLTATSASDRSPYPNVHNKYWSQRYRYFPRFDEGIRMTEAAWYSVTPHTIASHVAQRLMITEPQPQQQERPTRYIMDACCGVGGNTIALALQTHNDTVIIAVDTDRVSLDCLAHNAVHVYGIPVHRLVLIHGDAVTALRWYKDGRKCRSVEATSSVKTPTNHTSGVKSYQNVDSSVKKEGQQEESSPVDDKLVSTTEQNKTSTKTTPTLEKADNSTSKLLALSDELAESHEESNPQREETPTSTGSSLEKDLARPAQPADAGATRGDPEATSQDCQSHTAAAAAVEVEETGQEQAKSPPPRTEHHQTTQTAELHDGNSTLPVIGGYDLLPETLDAVFLSPPWGGTDYSHLRHFTLDDITMETEHRCLLTAAVTASHRVAYYLPRNTNGLSVGSDLQRHCRLGGSVELEQLYLHHKLKALVMYVNRQSEVPACGANPAQMKAT